MRQFNSILTGFAVILGVVPGAISGANPENRGGQFFSFPSVGAFQKLASAKPGEVVLLSPEVRTRLSWNELIVSWNAVMASDSYLKVEVRALGSERSSRWYVMGLWSTDPQRHPRESVRQQDDENGKVDTDTLILKQPADRFQLRLTSGSDLKVRPLIKFLGVSVLDSRVFAETLPPNRSAWGKTINVPERSQLIYENGSVICSPTTVSMMLAHWSIVRKRPSLDQDVPKIVKGVYDPSWGGTGNWVFNTAYAGSLPGMRAYTTRLSDVSDLEAFIARGVPVGLSLCYNRLLGKGREPSGHLVVCVGFTEQGDVVINDPGTLNNVRKVFPRANLVDAWAYSRNTVYLIYPTNQRLPYDRFAHWDSSVTRRLTASALIRP